jgi:hypothetical protein
VPFQKQMPTPNLLERKTALSPVFSSRHRSHVPGHCMPFLGYSSFQCPGFPHCNISPSGHTESMCPLVSLFLFFGFFSWIRLSFKGKFKIHNHSQDLTLLFIEQLDLHLCLKLTCLHPFFLPPLNLSCSSVFVAYSRYLGLCV